MNEKTFEALARAADWNPTRPVPPGRRDWLQAAVALLIFGFGLFLAGCSPAVTPAPARESEVPLPGLIVAKAFVPAGCSIDRAGTHFQRPDEFVIVIAIDAADEEIRVIKVGVGLRDFVQATVGDRVMVAFGPNGRVMVAKLPRVPAPGPNRDDTYRPLLRQRVVA